MKTTTKIDYNQIVEVYWNLHKLCWSVRDRRSRLVIEHSKSIILEDCFLKVSEKSRQRVIQSNCKNVHAYIAGTISKLSVEEWLDKQNTYRKLTYNPYRFESFVDLESLEPIYTSPTICLIDKHNVYYT